MGIEPTSTAWEAVVLPMNYGRKCLFHILSTLVMFVNTLVNCNMKLNTFKKPRNLLTSSMKASCGVR